MSENNIATLKQFYMFSELSDKELHHLAGLCTCREVPAATILFSEGESGDEMFIITQGLVNIFLLSQGGERVQLARMSAGDGFGEIALMCDGVRTASAETIRQSRFMIINREAFEIFLEKYPSFVKKLAGMLASRLNRSNKIYAEFNNIRTSFSPLADPALKSKFGVTIVGYGYYGNMYIGPKYAKPGFLWRPEAVVDPVVQEDRFNFSVLSETNPGMPLFRTADEWVTQYFDRLDPQQQASHVIEIPLDPKILLNVIRPYIEAGVKQFVLPKPVVATQEQFDELLALIHKHKIKAAVASQWYYSDLPRMIDHETANLLRMFGAISKVRLSFLKQNGHLRNTTPPLLELPHVLQLINSTGLVQLDDTMPEVTGTFDDVTVIYKKPGHEVELFCSLNYTPTKRERITYPYWDVQERTLKVFFEGLGDQPGLVVDFWVKFDRSGDFAVRPGGFRVMGKDRNGNIVPLTLHIVEDQLLNMNRIIFETFTQPYETFENDLRSLSLSRYETIGRHLLYIQREWDLYHKDSSSGVTVV